MIRDITIGQYYQTDSLLHRLDPRTKLMGTLVFIVSLFVAGNWLCYALAAVWLAGMIRLSRVPVGFIVRGLKAVMILLLISVGFNLFLTNGETVLVRFWIFRITLEGLRHKTLPVMSLQYHPEAAAGPRDSNHLFNRFRQMVGEALGS